MKELLLLPDRDEYYTMGRLILINENQPTHIIWIDDEAQNLIHEHHHIVLKISNIISGEKSWFQLFNKLTLMRKSLYCQSKDKNELKQKLNVLILKHKKTLEKLEGKTA